VEAEFTPIERGMFELVDRQVAVESYPSNVNQFGSALPMITLNAV